MTQQAVHTEHVLHEITTAKTNHDDHLKLFRAPTAHDGSGTHKRLPHEIGWHEIVAGDLILAMEFIDVDREDGGTREAISQLQIWRVLDANDGELRILVNNIVGMAADGEFVYDRLAGLVGMPPSTGPSGPNRAAGGG